MSRRTRRLARPAGPVVGVEPTRRVHRRNDAIDPLRKWGVHRSSRGRPICGLSWPGLGGPAKGGSKQIRLRPAAIIRHRSQRRRVPAIFAGNEEGQP
jgi:hypothetical protein